MRGKCVLSESSARHSQGHAIAAVALAVGHAVSQDAKQGVPLEPWLNDMLQNLHPLPQRVSKKKDFEFKSIDEMWRLEYLEELDSPEKKSLERRSFTFQFCLREAIDFLLPKPAEPKKRMLQKPEVNYFLQSFMKHVANLLDAPPLDKQTVKDALEARKKIVFFAEDRESPLFSAGALLHLMHERLRGFDKMLIHAIHHKLKILHPGTDFYYDELLAAKVEKSRDDLFGVLKSKKFKGFVAALGIHGLLYTKEDQQRKWKQRRRNHNGITNKIAHTIYELFPDQITDLPECEEWVKHQLMETWEVRDMEGDEETRDFDKTLEGIPFFVKKIALCHYLTAKYFSTLDEIFTPEFLYWAAMGTDFFQIYDSISTPQPMVEGE